VLNVQRGLHAAEHPVADFSTELVVDVVGRHPVSALEQLLDEARWRPGASFASEPSLVFLSPGAV
jgi:hypothetical protein